MKPISIAEHTQFANPVTRVAIEKDGKYLMVQEGKAHVRGAWSFPGGKVDVGEQLSESALREVFEETGVRAELTGIIGMQHVLWDDRPGFTLEIILTAKAVDTPDTFPLSEEVLAVEWKTPEEIIAMAEGAQLRNAGQREIARMIARKAIIPLDSLVEVSSHPPPEAR